MRLIRVRFRVRFRFRVRVRVRVRFGVCQAVSVLRYAGLHQGNVVFAGRYRGADASCQ